MSTPNVAADIDAAIEHIKANPLSEDETILTLGRIQEQVSQPEAVNELVKEVEKLCDSALSVDSAFGHVSTLLEKLHAGAPQELHDPLNRLEHKWQGYRQTYISLLGESRDLAAQAQVAVNDLVSTLLPLLLDNAYSSEDKKQRVEEYCKALEVRELKAKHVSEKYTELQHAVVTFDDEWKETTYKFKDRQVPEIQGIEGDIKHLTDRLAELDSKIKPLLAVAGVGPLGLVAFPVGLVTVPAAIAASAALVKLTVERTEISKKLDQKKAEREELAHHGEVTVRLEANVSIAKQDFAEIATKLCAFASIWAFIRSDLDHVSETLEYATANPTGSRLYKARLRTVEHLYLALGQALQKYHQAIGGVLERSINVSK